ncbi:MAG TPA: hypothetical protein VGM20_01260 [Gemmatimonadales bacterium]|jgi:hypothetical protein
MTFLRPRVAIAAIVLATALPAAALAQRDDSYTWKLGLNAGIMAYQTRFQNTKVVPSVGGQVLIMAHRGGLLLSVDEGIGTNEHATQQVLFNDIRRYQAAAMAFPIAGPVEPYFGAGLGIMQVVGPRLDPSLSQGPVQDAATLSAAEDASASAFLSFVAGVQGRWKRFTVFGQYEANTAPSDDKLLKGAGQSLLGGLRIGLGSAREGINGLGGN